MMFFKKNANRDHDGDGKSALDVVVSGSNLLSVSWLNKSESMYFPGTLNNSHTYIEASTFCFFNSSSADWQKISSSCYSKGEKVFECVWPGNAVIERYWQRGSTDGHLPCKHTYTHAKIGHSSQCSQKNPSPALRACREKMHCYSMETKRVCVSLLLCFPHSDNSISLICVLCLSFTVALMSPISKRLHKCKVIFSYKERCG